MTGFDSRSIWADWDQGGSRDWVDVLAGLPLFAGLGKRKLRKVAEQAQFAEFARGETVLQTGARGDAFYVILGGHANVRGKPAARTLAAGDYFGEIALLDDEPRSATVVATDELHVMRLPRKAFLELVERNPNVARTIMNGLGSGVRRAERRTAAA